jgi:integrase
VDAGLESATKPEQKKDVTIGDLLDSLENDYRMRNKDTAKNRSTIKGARRAFGSILAGALTSAQVDAYITKRLAAGARPATVNRTTEIVRRAYKVAKHATPEIRHLSEKGNERKGFFNVEELEKVVNNLPEDLQDFTRFGYATGWRKGEISSLKWSDVEDGIIRLRGENSKNREPRQITIDGDLVEIVRRRRALRAVETPDGILLCEFVFHRDGSAVAEFRKSWKTACEAAGVDRLYHDLRRSAVRDMIRSGVPQSVAMKISGHKTASMFRRYDIASEGDLRQAMLSVQKYRDAERQKVVQMASV